MKPGRFSLDLLKKTPQYTKAQEEAIAEFKGRLTVPRPAVDPALKLEWEQVVEEMKTCRRKYDELHSYAYWATASAKAPSEGAFNRHMIHNQWSNSKDHFDDLEAEFLQIQDQAMRAGLQPAELEPDLVAFSEHLEDGTAWSWNTYWRKANTAKWPKMADVIDWNLRIPYDHGHVTVRSDWPESDQWDCCSVNIHSSRSVYADRDAPPTGKRRQITEYQKTCAVWRDKADKDYRDRMKVNGRTAKST